jgi:hypothetical protein
MTFEKREWRLIEAHYPLLKPEIASLRTSLQEDAMVLHGLIMWGLALQEHSCNQVPAVDWVGRLTGGMRAHR